MNNTDGFYRLANSTLQYAPNKVHTKDYTLDKSLKDTYIYPTEGGWSWFNNAETACNFYGVDYQKYYSGSLAPSPALPNLIDPVRSNKRNA